jgi:DNA-binding HxlR family transcriptional regulator
MTDRGGYGQFCPVAMAAEIVCTRWTPLVLRELCAGSTRFNELRRGVPRMSPSLLSKRLKELEQAGVIERVETGEPGASEYALTAAGRELEPIVLALGSWGQRWIETRNSLRNLDPSLLMWDMRRNLDVGALPRGRCVVQFLYPDAPPAKRRWWLVVDQGDADLCRVDPGFEVDLYVVTPLRSMTSIWMGLTTVATEAREGRLQLTGDAGLRRTIQDWLGLSPFARDRERAGAPG